MTARYIIVEFGAPRVAEHLPTMQPNRLAVMSRTWEKVRAFDGKSSYTVQPREVPSYGILTKVLAYTIFNPKLEMEFDWETHPGDYKSELVNLVKDGLHRDDDLIQQWFEAPEVLKLLNAADSWNKMLLAVHAICGGHECDSEVKRYVQAVLMDTPEEFSFGTE